MKNIRQLFDYLKSLKESDLQKFLDDIPKIHTEHSVDVVIHDHDEDKWSLIITYEVNRGAYEITELLLQSVELALAEAGTKSEIFDAYQIFPVIEYPYGYEDDDDDDDDDPISWAEFYRMKL